MKTVFSPLHAGHAGQMELIAGAIVPGFEKPSRAEIIKARASSAKSSARSCRRRSMTWPPPSAFTRPTTSTSCRRYGRAGGCRQIGLGDAVHLADARPARRRRARSASTRCSAFIPSMPAPSFVAGTWAAIKSSYDVALTAAALVKRRRSRGLRALPPARPPCRRRLHGRLLLHQQRRGRGAMVPRPGRGARRHPRRRLSPRQRHAGDLLRARRRAGAQSARRSDDRISVLPRPCRRDAAPAPAKASTTTIPMPFGTGWDAWSAALEDGLRRSRRLRARCRGGVARRRHVREGPDQPVQADRARTIRRSAARIARLGLPTLFVMEGGYAVEEIGINAVGVLTGFEDG